MNDGADEADLLAARLTGMRGGAHVNVIPLNPTAAFDGHASRRERTEEFAARLRDRGIHASVRRNRGVAIDAACGQLRARGAAGPKEVAGSARLSS